jgi:hypothetical protein
MANEGQDYDQLGPTPTDEYVTTLRAICYVMINCSCYFAGPLGLWARRIKQGRAGRLRVQKQGSMCFLG